MRVFRIGAALLAVVLLSAAPVLADTVSFNFTGGPGVDVPNLDLQQGGVGLIVRAVDSIPIVSLGGIYDVAANVHHGPAGLGVRGFVGDPLGAAVDQPTVDASIFDHERLTFDFTPAITVQDITFNFIEGPSIGDNGDQVHLIVERVGPDNFATYNVYQFGTGNNVVFNLAALLPNVAERTGVRLSLAATDWNDDFMVGGISVDYTPAAGPSVPLPTAAYAGMGLLSAMIAVRAVRRRS